MRLATLSEISEPRTRGGTFRIAELQYRIRTLRVFPFSRKRTIAASDDAPPPVCVDCIAALSRSRFLAIVTRSSVCPGCVSRSSSICALSSIGLLFLLRASTSFLPFCVKTWRVSNAPYDERRSPPPAVSRDARGNDSNIIVSAIRIINPFSDAADDPAI